MDGDHRRFGRADAIEELVADLRAACSPPHLRSTSTTRAARSGPAVRPSALAADIGGWHEPLAPGNIPRDEAEWGAGLDSSAGLVGLRGTAATVVGRRGRRASGGPHGPPPGDRRPVDAAEYRRFGRRAWPRRRPPAAVPDAAGYVGAAPRRRRLGVPAGTT